MLALYFAAEGCKLYTEGTFEQNLASAIRDWRREEEKHLLDYTGRIFQYDNACNFVDILTYDQALETLLNILALQPLTLD